MSKLFTYQGINCLVSIVSLAAFIILTLMSKQGQAGADVVTVQSSGILVATTLSMAVATLTIIINYFTMLINSVVNKKWLWLILMLALSFVGSWIYFFSKYEPSVQVQESIYLQNNDTS